MEKVKHKTEKQKKLLELSKYNGIQTLGVVLLLLFRLYKKVNDIYREGGQKEHSVIH